LHRQLDGSKRFDSRQTIFNLSRREIVLAPDGISERFNLQSIEMGVLAEDPLELTISK
jgi:hypothetical protein